METIAGTGAAWLEALEHGRLWNEERDTPRLREAFTKLMGTATQWPSPAKLIESLPAIVEKPALPAKTFTDAERLANLDRLADLAKGIGTGEKPECETCGGLGGLFTGGGTWDGDCHDCKKEEKPLEMR